jgi:putative toxin-antitoxin system antitoxin component (TIGR02293 family)
MTMAAEIVELVGGARAWAAPAGAMRRQLPTSGTTVALESAWRALRYSAAEVLAKRLHVTIETILKVIHLSGRTAQRRAQTGTLSAEESDRLMRVAAVVRRAVVVFGDENKARLWLTRDNRVLGMQPLLLLGSELECIEVEAELTRVEYGEFS